MEQEVGACDESQRADEAGRDGAAVDSGVGDGIDLEVGDDGSEEVRGVLDGLADAVLPVEGEAEELRLE